MPRRTCDPNAPYQSITSMARISGLSPRYIRDLCKAGKCPYIPCGNEYRINKDLFLQILAAESEANMKGATKQ